MHMNLKNKQFIPALKYNWLTDIYNPILRYTMPEFQFKTSLINQAKIEKNHIVLDFGIGTATLSILVKQKHSEATVTGVDVDSKIINIAKKKILEAKTEIHIDQYDGIVLPYEDNTFDRVISSLVFHHLDAKQKNNSLKEIKRVLKPNGELHIADWGKPSNTLMRGAFYFVQFLDGFKTTKDNVRGLLPNYINKAGFDQVFETNYFDTIFGTVRLVKARKTI
jgi:ubiquinone/menaquinone biosynthesis C-methylase UbiE